MQSPIFGSFYSSRSTNLADQRCINLYPEIVETKSGKAPGALYGTPGLTFKATVGAGPIQALAELNGVVYVISGGFLYSLSQDFVPSLIAPIPASGVPGFQLLTNGKQVGAIAGTSFYVYGADGTGAFRQVALPFTVPVNAGAISGCQCDGFVLLNQPGTNQIWQSDVLDMTVFDGLSFASASGNPDNVIALAQQHLEVFVIKETNTQIFVDAGQPGFAFQVLTDVFIEVGTIAQRTVAPLGESLVFLAKNLQGSFVVVQLKGYTPVPISTHAISLAIGESTLDDISSASAFTYTQDQHQFYVLTIGQRTFVYDETASSQAQVPLWHERAAFADGSFSRHWGSCAVFAFGLNLVGDYRNGNIYAFDLDNLLDNGTPRKWLRSWRALPKALPDPVRFSELQIDMQTGIGVPNGTNPQVMLRWSDDGGHNWANMIATAAGQTGQTAQRVRFNRLGSTRRGGGLDRIFELSSSDMFPAALIGAELR